MLSVKYMANFKLCLFPGYIRKEYLEIYKTIKKNKMKIPTRPPRWLCGRLFSLQVGNRGSIPFQDRFKIVYAIIRWCTQSSAIKFGWTGVVEIYC